MNISSEPREKKLRRNLENYDIKTAINAFKEKADNAAMSENDVLSFLGHAAGVYALYSPAVQEKYHGLKEKYFSPVLGGENSTSEPLKDPKFYLKESSEDDFVVKFLAYLRLHNRSEKRCLKQKVECADTSWAFFEAKDVILLKNSGTCGGFRNEQVSLCGDYWIKYIKLINDLTPDEKAFLLDTRANLMKVPGNTDLITNSYLTLWYLLFGCEVIKNPAALIHHNMALDLLSAGKMKWGEDMIDITPMLSSGSIKKAMALNEHYTNFMPHPYLYQEKNDFSFKDQLVRREARITENWLELKLGKIISAYLINQCKANDSIIASSAAEAIWLLIMESFEGWGLNAVKHPVAF